MAPPGRPFTIPPFIAQPTALRRWLEHNWPALTGGTLIWANVMAAINEAGVRDINGNPVTLAAARQALYRLRKERGVLRPYRRSVAAPASPGRRPMERLLPPAPTAPANFSFPTPRK